MQSGQPESSPSVTVSNLQLPVEVDWPNIFSYYIVSNKPLTRSDNIMMYVYFFNPVQVDLQSFAIALSYSQNI